MAPAGPQRHRKQNKTYIKHNIKIIFIFLYFMSKQMNGNSVTHIFLRLGDRAS